jgi:hypothetical protein
MEFLASQTGAQRSGATKIKMQRSRATKSKVQRLKP